MRAQRSAVGGQLLVGFMGYLVPAILAAQTPGIAGKTHGMQKLDGFVPVYWDSAGGKLFLELTPGRELLYVVSLPGGLGSNDIGLDRSQLGGERVVRFDRVGPKVLMVQPNLRYRAEQTSNPAEKRAVEESFASSVLWGFRVEAATDGRVLVDATEFALRDAHGVVPALVRARQGTWRLDPARSALYPPRTRAFPRNTEVEVTLTFAGEQPGAWVRDVTPTPEAITVRQRHSFIELPGPGYGPRNFDPRAGYFEFAYTDYAAPFPEPVTRRFITRHRLEKRDPSAPVSEPVEPIVYYLDPGVPEPVRQALLDGARWWNQAFEAAGYRNAFRIEVLPDSADPMDVRYNVIQWVHRATRGWSYGSTVTDPRTGEIIKGHVSLGSLRVRQDYLLAEGLLSPYAEGVGRSPEAEAMALARIRQLSAHEVGHTLGLAHNYVASAQGRASVMDYPHPRIRLTSDGRIDLSDAYAEGIGAWDKVAITWGYQDFPEGTDEAEALDRVLGQAREKGLTFLTDQDARPAGSAHPGAHLWDNGNEPAAELGRLMEVRRVALTRFGENAIRRGMPLATLEETLVPLYLHHRYQVEAAVKLVGGVSYSYALRGDGQPLPQPVSGPVQRSALDAVLATLRAKELALPEHILRLLPPRPAGYEPSRELFERGTGAVFDAIRPAAAAADLVVSLLFEEARAARLVQQRALDPSLPGLDDVIDRALGAVFGSSTGTPYHAEIDRAVQRVVVERLMDLAAEAGTPQVRAVVAWKLDELRRRLSNAPAAGVPVPERAHRQLLAADIRRLQERDWSREGRPRRPIAPPGSPIGIVDH